MPVKAGIFTRYIGGLGLRLLPGTGGGSPARRGAWGERGRRPSTPPAPPYSPFCGNAKAVSLMGQYLARRVSRGASARTFPALPGDVRAASARTFPALPGDVRACCGAPSALRAHGIAFAPAPSLRRCRGRRRWPLSGNEGRRVGGRDEAVRQFQRKVRRVKEALDGRFSGKPAGGAVPGGSSAGKSGDREGVGRRKTGKSAGRGGRALFEVACPFLLLYVFSPSFFFSFLGLRLLPGMGGGDRLRARDMRRQREMAERSAGVKVTI